MAYLAINRPVNKIALLQRAPVYACLSSINGGKKKKTQRASVLSLVLSCLLYTQNNFCCIVLPAFFRVSNASLLPALQPWLPQGTRGYHSWFPNASCLFFQLSNYTLCSSSAVLHFIWVDTNSKKCVCKGYIRLRSGRKDSLAEMYNSWNFSYIEQKVLIYVFPIFKNGNGKITSVTSSSKVSGTKITLNLHSKTYCFTTPTKHTR